MILLWRDSGGPMFLLPGNETFSDLMKRLLNSRVQLGTESKIKHFSHDHRLALCNSSIAIENENGEEILCDACIEPILGQHYTCADECFTPLVPACHQKSKHLPHHLTLKNFKKELGYFYCSDCHMTCNGFFFECEICSFEPDLHCAIFSNTVAHQAHNSVHHLQHRVITDEFCGACGRNINGFGYNCDTCPDFHLHNLLLQFEPNCHHDENEFYCEVCEEEIHPKHWHYYCRESDQSFHPFCIPRLGKDRFMKFGSTIKVDIHQHLLTSVREGIFMSSCHSYGVNLCGHKGFECRTCTFFLCHGCACQVPPKPSLTNIVDPRPQQYSSTEAKLKAIFK